MPTPAQNDTPRAAVGTVPGTVRGAITKGTLSGIRGRVFPAILRPVCHATRGPFWQVTRRRILAAIRNSAFRPIRIAIRRLVRGATCRGTFGGTSTALCGLRMKAKRRRWKPRIEDGRTQANGDWLAEARPLLSVGVTRGTGSGVQGSKGSGRQESMPSA